MSNAKEPQQPRTFADYKGDAHSWITLATGEFYPDVLSDACEMYLPVQQQFGVLIGVATDSSDLLMKISETADQWMRTQLVRIFKRYVSPDTPVEMLKRKSDAKEICDHFGTRFRDLSLVQKTFAERPVPDEVLGALLWEYKDRGKKGYDLTQVFFERFRQQFPGLELQGPERAGKDVPMDRFFSDYPNPKRPIDFVVGEKGLIIAIGLARYDGDRGGAQEDDRTGGYANCANEFLAYAKEHKLNAKIIFLNDGPGLLLGSMWDDYAKLENSWPNKIMVLSLRMMPERLTLEWLKS